MNIIEASDIGLRGMGGRSKVLWLQALRHLRQRGASLKDGTFSFRSLTATYAAALLITAGLSIASHLLLGSTLRHSEGTAAVINMAGRQRMLSQRVASLAAQRQMGDPTATKPLEEAIDAFQAAHVTLSAPYGSAGSNWAEKRLHTLYFEGANPLDRQVRSFIATTRSLLAIPAGDPAAIPFLHALFDETRVPLLSLLDEVTAIEQHEGEDRVAHLELLQSTVLGIILATLLLEAMVIFRPMITRIMLQLSEILHLATTDSLTGAANRRSFLERWDMERATALKDDRPLSVLLMDVDHFKDVNDTMGHAAGDAALWCLCETIRRSMRATDMVGRIGGEEFAVLLPNTGHAAAAALAERVRGAIESSGVRLGEHRIAITVSVGVATLAGRDDGVDTMLSRADALMYRAKQTGRNRVASEVG